MRFIQYLNENSKLLDVRDISQEAFFKHKDKFKSLLNNPNRNEDDLYFLNDIFKKYKNITKTFFIEQSFKEDLSKYDMFSGVEYKSTYNTIEGVNNG